MSDKVNEVRQILMNELGLTRESVRAEMVAIVEDAVAKQMARLVNDGFLEKIVVAEFNRIAKKDNWDRDRIGGYVVEAAKREAEAFVRTNLRFEAVPSQPPALTLSRVVTVTQLSDGLYVSYGDLWHNLDGLKANLDRFHAPYTLEIRKADPDVEAFWQHAKTKGATVRVN